MGAFAVCIAREGGGSGWGLEGAARSFLNRRSRLRRGSHLSWPWWLAFSAPTLRCGDFRSHHASGSGHRWIWAYVDGGSRNSSVVVCSHPAPTEEGASRGGTRNTPRLVGTEGCFTDNDTGPEVSPTIMSRPATAVNPPAGKIREWHAKPDIRTSPPVNALSARSRSGAGRMRSGRRCSAPTDVAGSTTTRTI